MSTTNQPAADQMTLWNGSAGRAWIDLQDVLDQLFKPFEALLVETVSAAQPARVLDVGCGTGATTLAMARQLGAAGSCTGIDISTPMLAVARARAEQEHVSATFIAANAETHAFEPASFDLIVSRFGVMFFDDPIRAFVNLHHAARDQAALRLIVWRAADENPFMTTAERAAAPLLSNIPARRADGPGQFAFAERHRVSSILESSGWSGIDLQPLDVPCAFPESALVDYLTRLGPVGMILQGADEHTRARITKTVRAAFDPYVFGDEVRFTAACWMIDARARHPDLS